MALHARLSSAPLNASIGHGFGRAFNLVMIGLEALVVAGLADDQRCRDDRALGNFEGEKWCQGQLGVFLALSRLFWSRGFPTVAAAVTCRLSTRAADVRPTSPDAPVAECFSSSVARSLVMPELIRLRHWVAAI
jgi:hypothetical protein